MVYNGTCKTETIWFSTEDDFDELHYIELHRADDESVFYVTTCCNDEWIWAFNLCVPSNYDMIKFVVMDEIFECCCMSNLLETLDEIFTEEFMDIVVQNTEECECNVCCENCNHRDCLNQ